MSAIPNLQQQQDALAFLAGILHTIPDDDPIRQRAALMAYDILEYAKRAPQPSNRDLFPGTLRDLASAIQKKGVEVRDPRYHNCRAETLRNLNLETFLTDKGFGEGIGYWLPPTGKTKIRLAREAEFYVVEHYHVLLDEYGWKPQRRKARAEISMATNP